MKRAQTFRKTYLPWAIYLLFAIAVVTLATGCTRTSAQQVAPPPPQVTIASVIERNVTEWDEFTGRLQAVDSVDYLHQCSKKRRCIVASRSRNR